MRVADALSLRPAALGGAGLALLFGVLALVLFAGGAAGELLAGVAPAETAQDVRVAVVLSLILAYLPAAQLFAAQRAQRSLRELAPVLDLTPAEIEGEAVQIAHVERRTLRRAVGLGALIVLTVGFLPEILVTRSINLSLLNAISLHHRLLAACIGLIAGSFVALMGSSSRRIADLSRRSGRLDLFDMRGWDPLVRLGLTNAFVTAGVVSLLMLLVPDRDAGEALGWGLLVSVLGVASLGALGLVLPLLGLRERIRTEKRERLDGCHRQLEALLQDTAPPTGRLADLAAYKRLLDDVSEWPLDLPQVARFALLFGLPLLSWIAAALVERLLDRAIG